MSFVTIVEQDMADFNRVSYMESIATFLNIDVKYVKLAEVALSSVRTNATITPPPGSTAGAIASQLATLADSPSAIKSAFDVDLRVDAIVLLVLRPLSSPPSTPPGTVDPAPVEKPHDKDKDTEEGNTIPEDEALGGGAIAGIIIAVLAVFVLICIAVVVVRQRKADTSTVEIRKQRSVPFASILDGRLTSPLRSPRNKGGGAGDTSKTRDADVALASASLINVTIDDSPAEKETSWYETNKGLFSEPLAANSDVMAPPAGVSIASAQETDATAAGGLPSQGEQDSTQWPPHVPPPAKPTDEAMGACVASGAVAAAVGGLAAPIALDKTAAAQPAGMVTLTVEVGGALGVTLEL